MKVKTYKGFEIEKDMKLLNGTKKVLDVLAKRKAVKVIRDDGVEGYEVMTQLVHIADAVGLNVFPPISYQQIWNKNFPYQIVILSDSPCEVDV